MMDLQLNTQIWTARLQEQALELEKCVKNNAIESNIFPHTEMLQVMGLMDEIRSIIGLEF